MEKPTPSRRGINANTMKKVAGDFVLVINPTPLAIVSLEVRVLTIMKRNLMACISGHLAQVKVNNSKSAGNGASIAILHKVMF